MRANLWKLSKQCDIYGSWIMSRRSDTGFTARQFAGMSPVKSWDVIDHNVPVRLTESPGRPARHAVQRPAERINSNRWHGIMVVTPLL